MEERLMRSHADGLCREKGGGTRGPHINCDDRLSSRPQGLKPNERAGSMSELKPRPPKMQDFSARLKPCPDEIMSSHADSLALVPSEKFFGVHCGHAAGACGGDGLAIVVVLDVAGREDAFDAGLAAVVGEQVARVVHLEEAAKDF